MKKSLFCSICICLCLSLSADFRANKSGKVLIVELTATPNTEITMELIKEDFLKAMSKAVSLKCKALELKDKNGEYYFIVVGKEELLQPDKHFDRLAKQIEAMKTSTFIKGEAKVIKYKTSAMYVSETYLNGKLKDTYESEWTSGPFTPKTSTYRTGLDTYVTKTYYRPPQTKESIEYGPGTSTTIPGIINFAEKCFYITFFNMLQQRVLHLTYPTPAAYV